ncbi:MAG TPA: DUF302 domain-containing protein [Flammeovirgaceae bacterium]|nr:DUF302 domain-containing protein [Flammeovirgaceae bacterium]
MKYYYNKTVEGDFEQVIEKVTEALKTEGFGVLTEIDFSGTIKKKLDKDMPAYRILGACNPNFAYKAYQAEDKIGTMLPCNVIVQDAGDGKVEVSAVNPIASMMGIENDTLADVAGEVKSKLERVIDSL